MECDLHTYINSSYSASRYYATFQGHIYQMYTFTVENNLVGMFNDRSYTRINCIRIYLLEKNKCIACIQIKEEGFYPHVN